MSKIVSPYPPISYFSLHKGIPEEARWWRCLMSGRNWIGEIYVINLNGDDPPNDSTYYEIEWFDGLNTIIDAGLDRPTVFEVAFYSKGFGPMTREFIDVLAVDPPTAGPWCALTDPGDFVLPWVSDLTS